MSRFAALATFSDEELPVEVAPVEVAPVAPARKAPSSWADMVVDEDAEREASQPAEADEADEADETNLGESAAEEGGEGWSSVVKLKRPKRKDANLERVRCLICKQRCSAISHCRCRASVVLQKEGKCSKCRFCLAIVPKGAGRPWCPTPCKGSLIVFPPPVPRSTRKPRTEEQAEQEFEEVCDVPSSDPMWSDADLSQPPLVHSPSHHHTLGEEVAREETERNLEGSWRRTE